MGFCFLSLWIACFHFQFHVAEVAGRRFRWLSAVAGPLSSLSQRPTPGFLRLNGELIGSER